MNILRKRAMENNPRQPFDVSTLPNVSTLETEMQDVVSTLLSTVSAEQVHAEIGKVSAEAVEATFKTAAHALEELGNELRDRMRAIEQLTGEMSEALKTINDLVNDYREAGKVQAAKIEAASQMTAEVRKACEDMRVKLGEVNK